MARARRALALLSWVGFALCAWGGPATAQLPEIDLDERVEITADRIQFFQRRQLYVAEGNVHIVQGEKSLRARWVTFSNRTRLGVASGEVRYLDGRELVEARFLEFDVDTLVGVVFGGRLDLGEQSLRIAAEELVRTGEDRYRIFDARFTTCRCADPDATLPWEIQAKKSNIEIGGYGVSENTLIRMLGTPVFWIPWLAYPVKTERQSGLLIPEFSFGGRNGFSISQPIFWAAREDLNIVASPGWSEDRGYKQDLDIETVYGERSRTRLSGGLAWDKNPPVAGAIPVADNPNSPPADPPVLKKVEVGTARGFVDVKHDQFLPGDVRFKVDLQYVSDNQYVLDFDDLEGVRRNRFLESAAFVFRHFGSDGRFGAELASLYGDDLQSSEAVDRDPFLLQRLADLDLQWLSGPVGGLSWLGFGLDVDYEYFDRRQDPQESFEHRGFRNTGDNRADNVGMRFVDAGIDATPEDVEGDNQNDGLFQEGEPLLDFGHRATIHPRLSVPLRLGRAVEWNAEVGWKQTLYYSHLQDFEERGLATGRSDLQVRLDRKYSLPGGQTLEHRMIPRISWAYVSQDRGQRENPLFTPKTAVTQYRLRQRELDNILLDNADVIPATNRLVAALDHRLYRGSGAGRTLWGELGFGFDYDFASGGRVGSFIAEGRRIRILRSQNRFQLAINAHTGKVDEFAALTSIVWPWRISTTFGYRLVPDGPDFFEAFQTAQFRGFSEDFDEINQLSANIVIPIGRRLFLRYSGNYSFAGGFFLTNSGGVEYRSMCRCWAAGVDLSESRDEDLRVRFRFTLITFGDDANNPFAAGGGWLGSR